MSLARLETVVDGILRLLEDLPPAYRLHALRMAEEKVKPLSIIQGDIVRKLTRTSSGGGYLVALPASLTSLSGTYRARIEEGKLILEPGGDDARIRKYGTRLKLMLPKRLVETLGFPSYVRIRVENGRIVVEPA